jgi:transporter family-2 protein
VDRGVAVILTAFTGGLIALQAPINSQLGKSLGTFQASALSFLVGSALLVAIAVVAGAGPDTVREAAHQPWWYLTGGLLGAAYVTSVLVTVRTLGAGGVTAATIAGQLTASVVVDQLGILGVAKQPLTLLKVVGIVLLAAGVYLIVRD